ncbi:MAG: DUF1080 domain-containing protein [Candidatus Hydrogenedentes bacterium]|nr:DUF1080 domain-containing protein [Candidatus Hydrogenedentota bacterium]
MAIKMNISRALRGFALAFAFALASLTHGGVLTAPLDLFSTGDLSQCRAASGDWTMVGEVTSNSDDEKRLAWTKGTAVAVNGENGKTLNLHSAIEHGDVQLHVEFIVPKGSNSGVYLMGRYEIQVLDSWGVEKPKYSDCGGIYEQDGKNGAPSHGGVPPRVNAAKKPGEWQTYDITFRAPRFDKDGKKTKDAEFVKVVHNGIVIHENEPVTGPTRSATFKDEQPTGPLMFQGDHGPVAYRNVRLELLE